MYFSIWAERVEGSGEDAYPTTIFNSSKRQSLMAVYDGIGGSGTPFYALAGDVSQNNVYSGAYLASRLAKKVTEGFFEYGELDENFVENLQYSLQDDFKGYLNALDNDAQNELSFLSRRLPTTIAGMYFLEDSNNKQLIITFKAGSSRCYFLTSTGLLQLSSPSETLENNNLNCVNADTEFQLQQYKSVWEEPVICLVATEGCWKYLPSEAHFEYALLQGLMQSNSFLEWKENLQKLLQIDVITDMSLSLVAKNFGENFKEIKVHFFDRLQKIKEEFIQPIEELDKSIKVLEYEREFLNLKIEQLKEERERITETLANNYKELDENNLSDGLEFSDE